jgi:hypothetical protein
MILEIWMDPGDGMEYNGPMLMNRKMFLRGDSVILGMFLLFRHGIMREEADA